MRFQRNNKKTYENKTVVKFYEKKDYLQPPEKTIHEEVLNMSTPISMLDIGVGGGRTTAYFHDIVDSYTGIDYSNEMIESCISKFSNIKNFKGNFKTIDARDMSSFKDDTFDIVLFSFNGIDYVDSKDRDKILLEIQRVLKKGGVFYFSTHNLYKLPEIFMFKAQLQPIHVMPKKIIKWFLLRFIFNKNVVKEISSGIKSIIINDGSHQFSSNVFYIDPLEQIRILTGYGFSVQSLSLKDGRYIDKKEIKNYKAPWLYYKCELKIK